MWHIVADAHLRQKSKNRLISKRPQPVKQICHSGRDAGMMLPTEVPC
jgi:hypothetical protein